MANRKFIVIIIALVLIIAIMISAAIIFFTREDAMWLFGNKISTEFQVTNDIYYNPLMGFATDATSKTDVGNNSLVYIDITFREFEPEEGLYAFEQIAIDNNIEYWRSLGKHAVLRFQCDYPTDEEHIDIPDWLYEKTSGDGTNYDIEYGMGYSPNYNNEIFIEYHAKAIKALGEYFGNDDFVSYVQLGSLGHWGEWHVYYEGGIIRIPNETTRLKYIEPYPDAFPNAKLLMRRPFKAAAEYGFGLYNDMTGDPDSTDSWNEWLQYGGDYTQAEELDALVPMMDAWKTAPIGGEFTSSLSMDWLLKVNIDQTIQMLSESHVTFLGPKYPELKNESDELFKQGIDKVLFNMGYRYNVTKSVVTKSKWSSMEKVEITWSNTGVAPMYWDWPVYLYVLDNDNNILDKYETKLELSTLLPGTEKTTKNIIDLSLYENSEIKLCVGIIDPMTKEPAVMLISDNEKVDKLYIIYKSN
ncbi:MAG: hypothetical protein A2Y17_03510 [Clostridiales bacterium GWF2_38_85]|nr:MAG: hypothetical protein A2Y17_03510 [Clostridiales bacterium GWF2_38_85]